MVDLIGERSMPRSASGTLRDSSLMPPDRSRQVRVCRGPDYLPATDDPHAERPRCAPMFIIRGRVAADWHSTRVNVLFPSGPRGAFRSDSGESHTAMGYRRLGITGSTIVHGLGCYRKRHPRAASASIIRPPEHAIHLYDPRAPYVQVRCGFSSTLLSSDWEANRNGSGS